MSRRYFSSTFSATTLTAGVNTSATLLAVAAMSGAPASVPWTAVLDRGTASEELVTVTNVAGLNLTVTRGVDGTTGKTHSINAAVEHVVSARDFDEANAHIQASTAVHGITDTADLLTETDAAATYVAQTLADAKGDILVATAADTITRKAIGTNDTVLTADSAQSTGLKWATPNGVLLDYCQYDPAGGVTQLRTSTTFTALDTTNLRVTFVAPTSGVVTVEFGAWGSSNGNASNGPNIGVLDGATVKAVSGYQGQGGVGTTFGPINATRVVTGLTPGATYNWDLAFASSDAAANIAVGYGLGLVGSGQGAAYLLVRAA